MSMIADDDRQSIRDSLSRYLVAEASEEKLRRGMEDDRGYNQAIWQQLGEMGLLGIAVGEDNGGIGGGAIDIAMVAEELGRSLVPAPFIESSVIGAALLEASVSEQAAGEALAKIISGEATLAVAGNASFVPYCDPSHSLALGDAGKVSGEVSLALHGAAADYVLLGVESSGVTAALLVQAGEAVHAEPQQANDPALRPAKIRFDNADATPLGNLTDADFENARLRGIAALAAQQAGGARAIFEITVEYLNTRYQFGRPIGSFQALKHMAADLFVEVESTTSAARAAALAIDTGSQTVARTVALAGFVCTDAFREVSAQAIQMHGGIAYTREHVAHLYWRRARAMLPMLGDSAGHREAYLKTWETPA